MKTIDLTYHGKIKTLINVFNKENLDLLFTIEGRTGKTTTTSIKISNDLMITFNYQDLKKIVEDRNE